MKENKMNSSFLGKKRIVIALLWFAALLVSAVAAPLFLKTAAESMDFFHVLEAPSAAHWMGTDSLGRDLLARLLYGAGVSLSVGFVAVGLSIAIGVILGSLSGYYGGWTDRLIMGFVDVLLCFPVFFLILAVIAIVGPNILNIMIVIGVTSWMGTARLIRAEILALKERDFILAARALGAGDLWIVTKHLIPNAMGPVIVNAILGISSAVLAESALSFLGIGVQPPTPSWGNILMEGKATIGVAWWLLWLPGLMIFFTVMAANILGEALQEKLKGSTR